MFVLTVPYLHSIILDTSAKLQQTTTSEHYENTIVATNDTITQHKQIHWIVPCGECRNTQNASCTEFHLGNGDFVFISVCVSSSFLHTTTMPLITTKEDTQAALLV